jgi:hypothetical protein
MMPRLTSWPRDAFDRLYQRRTEREFTRRVERAFQADAGAIARVRAQLLAQVPVTLPAIAPVAARVDVRRRASIAAASFAALAIAVLGGLAVAGALKGPNVPSAPPVAIASADIDRSAAYLQDVIATARTGDQGALGAVLTTYQANLVSVEADVQLPGADLVGAARSLRSQALALAAISGSVSASNLALFQAVMAHLDQIIASLPDPSKSGHPGPADHPGSTDHPGPTDHPGANGHPSPPDQPQPTHKPLPSQANGKGNGNANGNGNAGGNGKANGQGH